MFLPLFVTRHQIRFHHGQMTVSKIFYMTITTKDSSVTDQIFIQYILHLKTLCYPDAEDKPGKCVLMKADSGPGRMNKEFLAIARSHGFYFLPGLPNGTALGQEMDQVFAEFMAILEENRALLYKTLFSLPVDEN